MEELARNEEWNKLHKIVFTRNQYQRLRKLRIEVDTESVATNNLKNIHASHRVNSPKIQISSLGSVLKIVCKIQKLDNVVERKKMQNELFQNLCRPECLCVIDEIDNSLLKSVLSDEQIAALHQNFWRTPSYSPIENCDIAFSPTYVPVSPSRSRSVSQ